MSDYPPTGLSEGVQKLPEVSLSYNWTGFTILRENAMLKRYFSGFKKDVAMKNTIAKKRVLLSPQQACLTSARIWANISESN